MILKVGNTAGPAHHPIKKSYCCYGHCAREATCYNPHVIGGYRCDDHLPRDIKLPVGWDWPRVEAMRAKYDIAENMIPLTSGDMGVVAWGTINSVRAAIAKAEGGAA